MLSLCLSCGPQAADVPGGVIGGATAQQEASSEVGFEAVQRAVRDGSSVLVDARLEFQYHLGHIPGAVHLPFTVEDPEQAITRHRLRQQRVIVYCGSAGCDAAGMTADRLRAAGCPYVTVYREGWEGWSKRSGS